MSQVRILPRALPHQPLADEFGSAQVEPTWLTDRFEEQRPRLGAVAYRMLGSRSEAEDAVQDVWLRLNRSDADAIENLGDWLTTDRARLPQPAAVPRCAPRGADGHLRPGSDRHHRGIDGPRGGGAPGGLGRLALHVVLETLTPPERLAFVLHDLFAVPFDEIAPIVERSPAATRQLASRARRRVQGRRSPTSLA